MSALNIPQKLSNSGSIHDIASDQFDRCIVFGKDCKYAVILASYYGGKGYTTHKTEAAAVRAYRATKGYSRCVLDAQGNELSCDGWSLF